MVSTGYLVAMTPVRLKFIARIRNVSNDDIVFMMHYRVTTIILLVFSVLVTCSQFFGDPIDCIKGGDVPDQIVNTFCWVEGTFTIPRGLTKAIGTEVAHPGVTKYERFIDDDEVIRHKYYQWVSLVLFLQCLCFFVTHYLWKVSNQLVPLVISNNITIDTPHAISSHLFYSLGASLSLSLHSTHLCLLTFYWRLMTVNTCWVNSD